MTPSFTGVRPSVLKAAAIRGKHVHKAIDAHHRGFSYAVHLAEEERGYFLGALAFLRDSRAQYIASELEVVSQKRRVLGHIDSLYKMIRGVTILDWKCVASLSLQAVTRQVVGGYSVCLEDDERFEAFSPAKLHMAVQLFPDGTYQTRVLTHNKYALSARKDFLEALDLWWKKNGEEVNGEGEEEDFF